MKKIASLVCLIFLASTVIAWSPTVGSWAGSAGSNICSVLSNLKGLLQMIAGGVAVLVIVVNGVKWIGSSDDPGARKQAKEGIVHAVVGLVIVLIAVEIVTMVYGNSCT